MFGLEFTPSTVVVALIVLALVFLAVRRLVRNGMCDVAQLKEYNRTIVKPEDAAAARAAALPAPWWPTCRSEPLRSRTANRPIRRAS